MLTIPQDLRRKLHVQAGQTIRLHVENDHRLIVDILPLLTPDDLFQRFRIEKPMEEG